MIQLLALGVDVNGKDYDDRTALHVAASAGQTGVVDLLLEEGAIVTARDKWGVRTLPSLIHN